MPIVTFNLKQLTGEELRNPTLVTWTIIKVVRDTTNPSTREIPANTSTSLLSEAAASGALDSSGAASVTLLQSSANDEYVLEIEGHGLWRFQVGATDALLTTLLGVAQAGPDQVYTQPIEIADDAAARDTAIPAPVEGNLVVLLDGPSLQVYDNDAWTNITSATAANIADNSITTTKMANDAVTEAKIADDAVGLSQLKAGTAGKFLGYDDDGDPAELDAPETGGNPREAGTGLTLTGNTLAVTNPFTDADETKLDGIATGAEVNVRSNWNASTGDAVILNKPTIPAAPADWAKASGASGTIPDARIPSSIARDTEIPTSLAWSAITGKPSFAPANAEQNVQSDWNANSGDAAILNKPTIPTVRTDEDIRDVVAGQLTAGSNVTITEDDAANTLTIAASGGSDGASVSDASLSVSDPSTDSTTVAPSQQAVSEAIKAAVSAEQDSFDWATDASGTGRRLPVYSPRTDAFTATFVERGSGTGQYFDFWPSHGHGSISPNGENSINYMRWTPSGSTDFASGLRQIVWLETYGEDGLVDGVAPTHLEVDGTEYAISQQSQGGGVTQWYTSTISTAPITSSDLSCTVRIKLTGGTWHSLSVLASMDVPTIPTVPTDSQIGDKAFSNPPSDLTSDEQSSVRTAIGAGASGFSGSYDDLTNKPTIPDNVTDLSDTPSALGTSGQVLQVNSGATALEFVTPSAGSSNVGAFTDLSDTPSALGTAGQIVQVNSGATALEFAAAPSSTVADGSITATKLADDAVTAAKIADNSVDVARINPTGGTSGQVLTLDSSGDPEWATPAAGGSQPDASTTTKGIIEIATDTEFNTGTDATRVATIPQVKNFASAQASVFVVWDGTSDPIGSGAGTRFTSQTLGTPYDSSNERYTLQDGNGGTSGTAGFYYTNAFVDYARFAFAFDLDMTKQDNTNPGAGSSQIFWGGDTSPSSSLGWLGDLTKGMGFMMVRTDVTGAEGNLIVRLRDQDADGSSSEPIFLTPDTVWNATVGTDRVGNSASQDQQVEIPLTDDTNADVHFTIIGVGRRVFLLIDGVARAQWTVCSDLDNETSFGFVGPGAATTTAAVNIESFLIGVPDPINSHPFLVIPPAPLPAASDAQFELQVSSTGTLSWVAATGGSTYTAGDGLSLTGTTFSITDGGVDADMLASNSVTSAKIANDAVGTSELADNAVNSARIADSAVTGTKIAANAVDPSKLSHPATAGYILGSDSSGNPEWQAATSTTVADGSITATKLADNAVTNAKVADDAIGTAELSATGTPSSTTYLRGDNTWATPSVGSSSGDITAVSATSPLTGGGVSGDVTVGIQAASSSQAGSMSAADKAKLDTYPDTFAVTSETALIEDVTEAATPATSYPSDPSSSGWPGYAYKLASGTSLANVDGLRLYVANDSALDTVLSKAYTDYQKSDPDFYLSCKFMNSTNHAQYQTFWTYSMTKEAIGSTGQRYTLVGYFLHVIGSLTSFSSVDLLTEFHHRDAIPIATQAQAEAGTDNATSMTPLRTKQAIDSQRPSGLTELGSHTLTSGQTGAVSVTISDHTGYNYIVILLENVAGTYNRYVSSPNIYQAFLTKTNAQSSYSFVWSVPDGKYAQLNSSTSTSVTLDPGGSSNVWDDVGDKIHIYGGY